MKNEIIRLIQDFYSIREDEIECIFLGGSACLPYIDTPHDYDIYIVYKDYCEEECYLRFFKKEREELQALIQEYEPDAVVIPQYKVCLQNWLGEEIDVPIRLEQRSKLPTYAYLCPHFDIIIGSDTIGIKNFNVLSNDNNQRFIDALQGYKQKLINDTQRFGYIPKYIYHLLTGIYMLKNNSYELTQEQIANINLAHDGNCTNELYNYVLENI